MESSFYTGEALREQSVAKAEQLISRFICAALCGVLTSFAVIAAFQTNSLSDFPGVQQAHANAELDSNNF